MGKKNKRKEGSNSSDNGRECKRVNNERGPSSGNMSVSEILSQTNSVLFETNGDHLNSDKNVANDSVFEPNAFSNNDGTGVKDHVHTSNGIEQTRSTESTEGENISLKDILVCLRGIEGKLRGIDQRLNTLEEVKEKVNSFDGEIKKLWVALEDKNRKIAEKVTIVEEKVESTDFALGLLNDKIVHLEKERDELNQEVTYLQSQSMRSNLLFSNIQESAPGNYEDTEAKIRDFMIEKMKLAKEVVDQIEMERVHRVGEKIPGVCRKIVVKFLKYKDKEFVRKQWKTLQGTPYYISEQFPKKVVDKRKRLFPKLKAAREEGKRAWIAYDTLYVDGKAVKE